ncbi:MAG: aldose 1-epimerase family protein [Pirellulales bacterium]|nr:aldose 1-epimerase family protein [Pirellulales bacterium]
MTSQSWTLINAEESLSLDSFSVKGIDISNAAKHCQIDYQLLRGGLREGLHLLTIDAGAIRVAILPERGMGLWKAWANDIEIGWNSPISGPVHPQWVPVSEPSGLGWLDGFDELLVRCGLYSNGAPEFDKAGQLVHPLHGHIANLPSHRLDVSIDPASGEITVCGIVDEKRFHFHKLRLTSTIRLRPEELAIDICDEVTNLSENPGNMQLLYHINLGPPIHSPDSELLLPVHQMAPRDEAAASDVNTWNQYRPPTEGAGEQVHFFDLLADQEGRTRVVLKGAGGNSGLSLCYNTKQLPCFSQWKNAAPQYDGYVTGLEPATNYPNPRSFESAQGRVVPLEAGQTRRFELQLMYHPDHQSLATAERAVESLAAISQPTLHTSPRPDWSATP